MIDGPPQAGRKIWYTKMIVQLIWSITISELEKPHSLKWSKGHLRQQTGKQVISATLQFWNRSWKFVVLDCYIQCVMGEGIRCLKSLAVWDTTHKYERVVVGVLCVHYSRLSLFLPIKFLFEPVVDCTTHKGTGAWSLCIRSGRFPPNDFLFDRLVVRWIQKYSWLKTNLF